jgi:uncharacterized protein (TIGR03118 family)
MLSFRSRAHGRPVRTSRSLRQCFRPRVESLEERSLLSAGYFAVNLVSDLPGMAPITDPNLVNAWGIAVNPTGAFWVSDNGTGMTSLYTGDVNGSPFIHAPNLPAVSTVSPDPTGQVFNPFSSTNANEFVVSDGNGHSGPAIFIFASESGIVSGWNPAVPPPPPSTTAETAFTSANGAVYKGIAIGQNAAGAHLLYLADFHNGHIDVLNTNFQLTTLAGNFTDPKLPAGFAPFNVANLGGKLYVSYAKQDPAKHDDVAGPGNGFIDQFDMDGHFVKRLVSGGALNSPWGMVVAPANFGRFSKALIVGNFGDGTLHAYNPTSGAFMGTVDDGHGHPLVIGGLWGLAFGNGVAAGNTNQLYFSAGPQGESHGLFGKIAAINNLAGQVAVGRHIVSFDNTQLGGVITITNTSSITITGPVTVDISPVPSGVTLVNSNGQTPAGDPFITIHLQSLAPGQTMEVPILVQGSLLNTADYFESLTVSIFAGSF